MKYLFILLFAAISITVSAQTACMHMCDDQTYISSDDGSSITFYSNGKVAVNGKIDEAFTYEIDDCVVTLYYKKKAVNTLLPFNGQADQPKHFYGFIDKRNIRYVHLNPELKVVPADKK